MKSLFSIQLFLCFVLWSGHGFADKSGINTTPASGPEAIDAAGLVTEKCLICHAQPGPWPGVAELAKLSADDIYHSLWAGLMRELADGISDAERQAIANHIAALNPNKPSLQSFGQCDTAIKAGKMNPDTSASWPGWSSSAGNERYARGVTLDKTQLAGLRLKWVFVFPEAAFYTSSSNQATVVGNRLYIGNNNGMVYALDTRTGCTHWSFKARSHIRSTIAVSGDRVVFADYETNVYALDAQNGELRWTGRADAQPSARVNGNVSVHEGIVYVPISTNQEFTVSSHPSTPCCSFRGAIAAFDINSGRRVWKTSLIDTPLLDLGVDDRGVKRYGPSGVAVWSVPTVDAKRQLLYVTTGNQHSEPRVEEADALIALDLATGKKRWVKSFVPERFEEGDIWHGGCIGLVAGVNDRCPPLNPDAKGDREIGAPAVLKTLPDGKDIILIGSKDGVLFALDPDRKGATVWQTRVGMQLPDDGPIFGGIQFGLAVDDKRVYVPIADMRPVQQTAVGNFLSVDLESGKLAWQNPAPLDSCSNKPFGCNNGYMSAPTVVGNIVFAGANDGVLRAFDTGNGNTLWSYDTAKSYKGVNGLSGKGGSIVRSGPTIAGNMLFQTSGYGHFNIAMPGNVLLAFEFKKK